jgi:hypothetical protein
LYVDPVEIVFSLQPERCEGQTVCDPDKLDYDSNGQRDCE